MVGKPTTSKSEAINNNGVVSAGSDGVFPATEEKATLPHLVESKLK